MFLLTTLSLGITNITRTMINYVIPVRTISKDICVLDIYFGEQSRGTH